MKLKFLTLLFMVGVSFLVNARSFSQDHTVCEYHGEKIDFDIRGSERYVSGPDRDYGKVVVIKHEGNSSKVKFNDDGFGRYKMLSVYNEICPKILTMPVKKDELAFFLLKDNRPLTDKVMILYYNLKTHETEVVETKLHARDAYLKDGKAFFQLVKDEERVKTGTILIGEKKYTYIEKVIDPWVSFDGVNFKFERALTYDKFEYNGLAKKNQLERVKDFGNLQYKLATSMELGRKCISINDDEWECR